MLKFLATVSTFWILASFAENSESNQQQTCDNESGTCSSNNYDSQRYGNQGYRNQYQNQYNNQYGMNQGYDQGYGGGYSGYNGDFGHFGDSYNYQGFPDQYGAGYDYPYGSNNYMYGYGYQGGNMPNNQMAREMMQWERQLQQQQQFINQQLRQLREREQMLMQQYPEFGNSMQFDRQNNYNYNYPSQQPTQSYSHGYGYGYYQDGNQQYDYEYGYGYDNNNPNQPNGYNNRYFSSYDNNQQQQQRGNYGNDGRYGNQGQGYGNTRNFKIYVREYPQQWDKYQQNEYSQMILQELTRKGIFQTGEITMVYLNHFKNNNDKYAEFYLSNNVDQSRAQQILQKFKQSYQHMVARLHNANKQQYQQT